MNYIFIPKKGESTYIGIVVPVGSRDEPNEIKGISHFIEHMCFKGSKKLSCNQIAETIESIGGDINAFTSSEITCYWVRVPNEYKKRGVEIIDELVTKPKFAQKEIDKEREVIVQELKMYKDHPSDYAEDLFSRTFFDESAGLHLSTIGTEESLKNINREEILRFYELNYKNLTWLIVGDIKELMKYKYENNRVYNNTINPRIKRIVLEKRKDISQANIIIGNYLQTKESFINNSVLLELLGTIYNDMSGRLFKVIREKNHLCYGIHFTHATLSDILVNWQVTIGLEKEQINKAYKLIVSELSRPFSKEEIKRAVIKLKGEHSLYYENNHNLFNEIVYQTTVGNFDCLLNKKLREKTIDKLAPKINDYIKQLNFSNNLTVGVIPK